MKGTYHLGAPLPVNLASDAQFCAAEGKIYCIYNQGMSVYDPKTDKWEMIETNKIWTLRNVKNIVSVGGQIYLMDIPIPGSTNFLWAYSTAENNWTKIAEKPAKEEGFSMCVIEKKIYCVGGVNQKKIEVYDIVTDTWSDVSTIPNSVNPGTCVSLGEYIHCISGIRGDTSVRDYRVFNTKTSTWSEEVPIPGNGHTIAGAVLNNTICYVAGSKGFENFYAYDAVNKVWKSGPHSPLTFVDPRCVELDGKLYLFDHNNNHRVFTEIFVPEGVDPGPGPGPEPEPPVTGATLRLAIRKGQSQRLAGLQLPSGTAISDLTWTSGNPAIATVSDAGVVTGVTAGLATISATNADKSWSGEILVQVCSEDGRLSILLEIGESCQLLAWDDGGTVTWTSGAAAVATVSSTGQVLAVSAGIAPITAADSHGRRDTIYVKVEGAE